MRNVGDYKIRVIWKFGLLEKLGTTRDLQVAEDFI
jgi:hypothetical protein